MRDAPTPPPRASRAPHVGAADSSHQPSQELLAAPRAEHEHGAADGRAPRHPARCRDGHAQGVPAQVAREAEGRGREQSCERGARPGLLCVCA